MTDDELMVKLRELAAACDQSRRQQCVEAALRDLLGALLSNREEALVRHNTSFVQGEVMRLSASRN